MYLILRLRHIIQQKFQHQRTSKSPSFYLKIGKSHRHICIPDIINTDKCRILHCLRKPVSILRIRCNAYMVWTVLAKILAAHNLIAVLSVVTSEPASLITQEFHLILFFICQLRQLIKCFIQPEIRHYILEIFSFYFIQKIIEIRQHLRCR